MYVIVCLLGCRDIGYYNVKGHHLLHGVDSQAITCVFVFLESATDPSTSGRTNLSFSLYIFVSVSICVYVFLYTSAKDDTAIVLMLHFDLQHYMLSYLYIDFVCKTLFKQTEKLFRVYILSVHI